MRETRFQPRMKPQPTTLEARVMTCPTASGARMLVTWSIRLMVAFIPFVGAKDTAVNMTPPVRFQQDHKVANATAAFIWHPACTAATLQTAYNGMLHVRNRKKPIQIWSTQLKPLTAIQRERTEWLEIGCVYTDVATGENEGLKKCSLLRFDILNDEMSIAVPHVLQLLLIVQCTSLSPSVCVRALSTNESSHQPSDLCCSRL